MTALHQDAFLHVPYPSTDYSAFSRWIQHDVYFTWTGYHGFDGPHVQEATYIWNGEVVGRGDPGFTAVLKRLSRLPTDSRVLVYPYYPGLDPVDENPGHFRVVPYYQRLPELERVVRKRSLKLVCSLRDHEGKYHPDTLDALRRAGVRLEEIERRTNQWEGANRAKQKEGGH